MWDQTLGEVIPPDLRKALEVCADQAPILRGYAAEFAPARLRKDDFDLAPQLRRRPVRGPGVPLQGAGDLRTGLSGRQPGQFRQGRRQMAEGSLNPIEWDWTH